MNTKLYDILEISPQATDDEITKSYRKLAKQWHPDSPKNHSRQEEATEKFKEIGNAYKILSDPKSRQIYNQFGEEAVNQMAAGGGGNGFPGGFNPFEGFFPGMGRGSRGPQKGKPIHHQLPVPLRDLYTGKEYKFQIEIKNSCSECEGTGSKTHSTHQCQQCKGKGVQIRMQRMGPIIQQFQEKCSTCSGLGKKVPLDDQCQKCKGVEFVLESKEITVEIHPGMSWGNRFLMEGMGNTLRDQIPGDVMVELVPPQKDLDPQKFGMDDDSEVSWDRTGHNLHVTIPVSLEMALMGVHIALTTLDQRHLDLDLTKEIINPKTKKIIKGEGMPMLTQKDLHKKEKLKVIQMDKGDLIIDFEILFPQQLSKEAKKEITTIFNNNNTETQTNKLNQKYQKEMQEKKKQLLKVNIQDYHESNNDQRENIVDDDNEAEFDPRQQCAHQ